MTYRKKLIEVSLPLEAINAESAREKSIRHGHPSTLHLWWARRPLAACRAVLWSSLVDDPSEYMPDDESVNREREWLFSILEKLVKWENIDNEEVLDAAKLEIARSVARDLGCEVPVGKEAIREFLTSKAPPVLDPFAGGGSIPLEAQRLGLRAYASDLNPVAVLINKAMIEIPPKYAGMPPVHPPEPGERQGALLMKEWKGAEGLAEDVRYYGKWMRDEAYKRIGNLYPKVKITAEILAEREDLRKQGLKDGDELTVIAWLWARTVKCPNPACRAQMPLVRSFVLSRKKGKQTWVQPNINKFTNPPEIKFQIMTGTGTIPEGTVSKKGARCLVCGTPVTLDYIRSEGRNGNMSVALMAIISEGNGRLYLPPSHIQEEIASKANPNRHPDNLLPHNPRDFKTPNYGLLSFADLYTIRQTLALNTLCDLVNLVRSKIESDMNETHFNEDFKKAYSGAIITYLAIAIDRLTDYSSSICSWHSGRETIRNTFARQAIPMTWDYIETNIFSDSTGNFSGGVEWITRVIQKLPASVVGKVTQSDAKILTNCSEDFIISTDPPYYDNINYSELSDYFYVWIRQSLFDVYPELFATVLTPKSQELVANPYRFDGDREKAKVFFEDGLRQVFQNMAQSTNKNFPLTVYYAFKQTETDENDEEDIEELHESRTSTGWETMLAGLLGSGYQITGTWPLRTELSNRTIASEKNALASSIALVCRPRSNSDDVITRRDLLNIFKRELPIALKILQKGNIAPVDFAQAAIGPGISIFSRYRQILEADGSLMTVHDALALINSALDAFLTEQEGEFDGDTRWALAWYEQYGHELGLYGVAETLSKAKNTSVEGLSHAGFLEARSGKVRLLRRDELDANWDPSKDTRLTAWEAVQHLIRALDKDGEKGAGALLGKLGSVGETARDLAYRLYTICERKGWAQEALAYNMLVVAWPRLNEIASREQISDQGKLF